MKKIPLTQGKFALVDDEDFDFINQWKWQYHHNGYAVRMFTIDKNKRKFILMHRLIMKTQEKIILDHVNHNTLDNRKSNLRIVTNSQNIQNAKSKNKTGYKGVRERKCKQTIEWEARIFINGIRKSIGRFNTKKEAAKAYDNAAKKYFGEFAYTNF